MPYLPNPWLRPNSITPHTRSLRPYQDRYIQLSYMHSLPHIASSNNSSLSTRHPSNRSAQSIKTKSRFCRNHDKLPTHCNSRQSHPQLLTCTMILSHALLRIVAIQPQAYEMSTSSPWWMTPQHDLYSCNKWKSRRTNIHNKLTCNLQHTKSYNRCPNLP